MAARDREVDKIMERLMPVLRAELAAALEADTSRRRRRVVLPISLPATDTTAVDDVTRERARKLLRRHGGAR